MLIIMSESLLIISTHTLTWSVTYEITFFHHLQGISTHTLTWSVTGHVILDPSEKPISTHTLTWSVTSRLSTIIENVLFQLTRSRGA